jgi:hypothetical protein
MKRFVEGKLEGSKQFALRGFLGRSKAYKLPIEQQVINDF